MSAELTIRHGHILAALINEVRRGERVSDRIRTVDYLEAMSRDRSSASADLAKAAGLFVQDRPPKIADVAAKLLRVLRGEETFKKPNISKEHAR